MTDFMTVGWGAVYIAACLVMGAAAGLVARILRGGE
jgi:hypothetical protein